MRELQSFARTPALLDFVSKIEQIVGREDPLLLHGFVISRPTVWNLLRRVRKYPDIFRENLISYSDIGTLIAISILDGRSPRYLEDDAEYDDAHNPIHSLWKERFGERRPFTVKVCIAPPTPSTLRLRRQIENACALEDRFFAVVDERVPAILASVEGGREVLAGAGSGTIGGVLKDASGNPVGFTCGHVGPTVGHSVSAQDLTGKIVPVGKVAATNWPLTPSSGLCQPNSSQSNHVDIATIDFATGVSITNQVRGLGPVSHVYKLANLGSGNRVHMTGAVSGTEDYDITGYVMTYRVYGGSSYYCFSDIFEISGVPYNGYFSTITPTPKKGDSGAWVCCAASPTGLAFCGVLFAVDSARGYVCSTDEVMAWATSNGYSALSPF